MQKRRSKSYLEMTHIGRNLLVTLGLIINLSLSATVTEWQCQDDLDCSNKIYVCPTDECYLRCGKDSYCKNTTLYCDNTVSVCSISCNQINACTNAHIYGSATTNYLQCSSAEKACENTTFYCGDIRDKLPSDYNGDTSVFLSNNANCDFDCSHTSACINPYYGCYGDSSAISDCDAGSTQTTGLQNIIYECDTDIECSLSCSSAGTCSGDMICTGLSGCTCTPTQGCEDITIKTSTETPVTSTPTTATVPPSTPPTSGTLSPTTPTLTPTIVSVSPTIITFPPTTVTLSPTSPTLTPTKLPTPIPTKISSMEPTKYPTYETNILWIYDWNITYIATVSVNTKNNTNPDNLSDDTVDAFQNDIIQDLIDYYNLLFGDSEYDIEIDVESNVDSGELEISIVLVLGSASAYSIGNATNEAALMYDTLTEYMDEAYGEDNYEVGVTIVVNGSGDNEEISINNGSNTSWITNDYLILTGIIVGGFIIIIAMFIILFCCFWKHMNKQGHRRSVVNAESNSSMTTDNKNHSPKKINQIRSLKVELPLQLKEGQHSQYSKSIQSIATNSATMSPQSISQEQQQFEIMDVVLENCEEGESDLPPEDSHEDDSIEELFTETDVEEIQTPQTAAAPKPGKLTPIALAPIPQDMPVGLNLAVGTPRGLPLIHPGPPGLHAHVPSHSVSNLSWASGVSDISDVSDHQPGTPVVEPIEEPGTPVAAITNKMSWDQDQPGTPVHSITPNKISWDQAGTNDGKRRSTRGQFKLDKE